MQKLISVIIPAYNLEEHILTTLDSLSKQTHKNFEVIVVDDGSTDRTYEMTNKFLKDFEHLDARLYKQENGGVSSARNKGMTKSKGDYIYFLDGDDYISDNFFKVINKIIRKKYPDIISWEYDKIDSNGNLLWKYNEQFDSESFYTSGIDSLEKVLLKRNYSIWTCSAIYKRELLMLNDISFTKGCTAGEDLEFIYKSLSNAKDVYHINKVLSYYHQRIGSVIHSFNIKKYDSVIAMKRVAKHLESHDDIRIKNIAFEIKEKEIIRHYLNTTLSYFQYEKNPNNKLLYSLIESKYPNLLFEIRQLIKQYPKSDLKEYFKFKLLGLSPSLFYKLLNLKNK